MLAAGQIDGAAKLEEENKVDLGESSMEILSPANGDLLDQVRFRMMYFLRS